MSTYDCFIPVLSRIIDYVKWDIHKISISAGTYAKIEMDYYLITELVLWT